MLSCQLAKTSGIARKTWASTRVKGLEPHVGRSKLTNSSKSIRKERVAISSHCYLHSTPKRNYCTKQEAEKFQSKLKGAMYSLEQMMEKMDLTGMKETEVQIDRSGLHPFGLKRKDALSWKELEDKKGPRSELVKQLHALIETRGPMSMATFMNYALTHPVHGYYMKSDVFGKAGDFTTSPEISQMFGELLGVWCAAMWAQLGRPERLHIVELGPGRGTLASDMLSATKNMKDFFKSVHLHLVEVSPHLRRLQAQKFGLVYPATLNTKTINSIPVPAGLDEHVSKSSHPAPDVARSIEVNRPASKTSGSNSAQQPSDGKLSRINFDLSTSDEQDLLPDVTLKSLPGTSISWHKRFSDIPEYDPKEPILVIGQEFFDALPIYQLEMTDKGWRERLVDMDDRADAPDWFRTTIAPSATPACVLIDAADVAHPGATKVGMGIEKCAEGMAIVQEITDRLLRNSGAALFIDYGYEFTHGWSIRGIQNHEFVSIYKEPGEVDLSTNVDFAALARAAFTPGPKRYSNDKLKNLQVYGAANQGEFLASLGIHSRMATLLRKASTEADAEALIAAYHRLVDKRQMGTNYKVLGIFSSPDIVAEGFEGMDAKSMEHYIPPANSTTPPNPPL